MLYNYINLRSSFSDVAALAAKESRDNGLQTLIRTSDSLARNVNRDLEEVDQFNFYEYDQKNSFGAIPLYEELEYMNSFSNDLFDLCMNLGQRTASLIDYLIDLQRENVKEQEDSESLYAFDNETISYEIKTQDSYTLKKTKDEQNPKQWTYSMVMPNRQKIIYLKPVRSLAPIGVHRYLINVSEESLTLANNRSYINFCCKESDNTKHRCASDSSLHTFLERTDSKAPADT